jgi:hypothetical protein
MIVHLIDIYGNYSGIFSIGKASPMIIYSIGICSNSYVFDSYQCYVHCRSMSLTNIYRVVNASIRTVLMKARRINLMPTVCLVIHNRMHNKSMPIRTIKVSVNYDKTIVDGFVFSFCRYPCCFSR